MKLRPLQLVCLALLLATLRLADPTALAPQEFALRAGVLNALLGTRLPQEGWASAPRVQRRRSEGTVVPRKERASRLRGPGTTSLVFARWTLRTMPPPARQSAAVQSYTSFRRA